MGWPFSTIPIATSSTTHSGGSSSSSNHDHDGGWSRMLFLTVLIPVHVTVRVALSNRMPIMDCDETFNYWEPLHFLLYPNPININNTTGSWQTWEYSNDFALRTYAYLIPWWGLARMYQIAIRYFGLTTTTSLSWLWPLLWTDQQDDMVNIGYSNNKVVLFVLLRASLGAWMAWAELSLVGAIAKEEEVKTKNIHDGNNNTSRRTSFVLVAMVTEVLLLTCAGMGHAAAALLPSSTIMGLWMFAAAAFLRHQHLLFIVFAVTATLAVGWPFGVVMFVPLGLRVLFREYYNPQSSMVGLFFKIAVITSIILGIVMAIDYRHYGRLVSPVWNILIYNTQTGGDELYGVEPFSYYIKNILLNLNYVAIIGAMGAIAAPILFSWSEAWYLLLPMEIWMLIVAPRPHKEERFLFPIYPALCLGAAMLSVHVVEKLTGWWLSRTRNQNQTTPPKGTLASIIVLSILWSPAVLLSCSRVAALIKYYSGPLLLYARLPTAVINAQVTHNKALIVCTCGEWYRFPSSFFIPSELLSFGFAPSTFGGQLPQPFTSHGSRAESSAINKFNDKNEPEPGSYTSFQDCNFLVELSTSLNSCTEQLEEGYEWHPIAQEPFLNAEATTSTLHRSLYIPRFHERASKEGKVDYINFVLYTKKQKE
jgi:alpha-1,2-mannosyltransferase